MRLLSLALLLLVPSFAMAQSGDPNSMAYDAIAKVTALTESYKAAFVANRQARAEIDDLKKQIVDLQEKVKKCGKPCEATSTRAPAPLLVPEPQQVYPQKAPSPPPTSPGAHPPDQ